MLQRKSKVISELLDEIMDKTKHITNQKTNILRNFVFLTRAHS